MGEVLDLALNFVRRNYEDVSMKQIIIHLHHTFRLLGLPLRLHRLLLHILLHLYILDLVRSYLSVIDSLHSHNSLLVHSRILHLHRILDLGTDFSSHRHHYSWSFLLDTAIYMLSVFPLLHNFLLRCILYLCLLDHIALLHLVYHLHSLDLYISRS